LNNPEDNSSPNVSVPNPGSSSARVNQNTVSPRRNLKEAMKEREGRKIRSKKIVVGHVCRQIRGTGIVNRQKGRTEMRLVEIQDKEGFPMKRGAKCM
jgi:hypothetical protein